MAAISQAQCVVNVTAAAPAARSRVALRASFSGKSVAAKPAYFAAKRQSVLVRAEEKTAEKAVEKKEEAPWSPPKLNPNTPSPIFGGSTGGLLRKAQVRARFRRDLPSRLPSRWNIARLHHRSISPAIRPARRRAFPRGSRAYRASFSHRAMPARDVRPKCDRARGAIARAMPSARVFGRRGRSREIIFSVYPRDERPAHARERSQNRKLTPRRPPDPPPSLASSGRGVLRAHVGGAQGDDLRDAGARPRVASSRFSQSSPPSRRAGATPSTSVRSRRRPIDSRSDPAPLARPNNRAIR